MNAEQLIADPSIRLQPATCVQGRDTLNLHPIIPASAAHQRLRSWNLMHTNMKAEGIGQ